MRTPVCDLLGIEFPILAFSHCRDVVAAVSKAGGLGVLGAVAFTPEMLETELDWIENEVGDKPYGVDVLVPAKYIGIEEGGLSGTKLKDMIPDEHRAFVNDLMTRYGVPPLPDDEKISATGGLLSWSHKGAQPLMDVAFAHRTRLIANALGPAPDYMVEHAHANDVVVAGLVGKKQHAERQKNAGVDLIVAQGYEAGGHTGEISTMVLIPEVVDAVAPTPVLAAGGIGNGRQIAASLALGAQGVWCGSVWLTTEEAETHPIVKEKFLAATSSDTVRSRASTGKPARQLRTAWTDEWEDPANPDPLPMPLHGMLIADAQRRMQRSAASNPGAQQLVNYFVGQIVGQMNQVKPAKQVVYEMVEEFIDAAERVSGLLES
ncbi:MAG TPA: nitronate monooxygenase family protein [Acidimicrobiales bacterium]|jgi:NAD(P)H-dependent flavin oxidoreductase YrpB (nitropropane dioxygenase family)|nr:nitronate monooxygenase family protein [Acidimicrobiales bacterium]